MSTESVLQFLEGRQSIPLSMFGAPGPDEETLQRILRIALRVPDHGRLEPWRMIVYRPENAAAIGDLLLERAVALRGPLPDGEADRERNRLNRAPVAVGVVSCVNRESHIPAWEQFLSAGAACMNLVNAATAAGFAANWVTGWYSDDPVGRSILGLTADERMAGIVHIGSAKKTIPERPRPDLSQKITAYEGPVAHEAGGETDVLPS